MTVTVPLDPTQFGTTERVLLRADGLVATGSRTGTGVPALRLANARGHVTLLPWLGQIVWDAVFDGVRLTMDGLFDEPRQAAGILDTYGCFAFHSGLLRNGCPGPEDTHALHGEFAVAAMDAAELVLDGDTLRVVSTRTYAQGFGSRYRATAHVALAAGATLMEIGLAVENTGGQAMDVMYMCHVNFAFVAGARIVQPAPFSPEHVAVRRAIPAHVVAPAGYREAIDAFTVDPAASEILDPARYDPEQVFYLRDLGRGADSTTRLMLRRPEGDGFGMAFRLDQFPRVVRWLMHTPDHRVAAFALPSTCEPEGYRAEHRKGNVATLAPGARRAFAVTAGYLDHATAKTWEAEIAALPAAGTMA